MARGWFEPMHTLITIRVDVDLALLSLPTSQPVLRVSTQTPLGLQVIRRLTGVIFWIIGMRTQRRNGDVHPLHVYATNARDYNKYIH